MPALHRLHPSALAATTAFAAVAGIGPVPASTSENPNAIYKCRGEDGAPVYQASPCPAGRELRNFATDPGSVSVIPFAPPAPAAEAPRNGKQSSAAPPTKRTDRRREPLPGDAAERRHLREGMSEAEVMARVGAPDVTSGKSGQGVRWSWLPAAGDPQTLTTVRFESGKVVAVERRVVR